MSNLYSFTFLNKNRSKNGYKLFFIILIAALSIRFGMLWFVDYRSDVGDGRYYLDVARNILDYHTVTESVTGNPIPSMYRPPLYSFFLAGIFLLFGENLLYVQLVQILLSIVTIIFTTRISALYFPKAAPYVFGLMAISPFEAVYSSAILSETLVTFLFIFSLCALLSFKGNKRFMLSGLALGLCVLVRDIYLPLIIIFALCIAFFQEYSRPQYRNALIFLILACLVVAPWTIRNFQISQRFVPVSEGRLGLSLWMGTWATDGKFTSSDANGKSRIYPTEAFRNQDEKNLVEKALRKGVEGGDRELRAFAVQRIIENPVDVFKVYFVRAPLLWLGTRFDIFQLNKIYFPRGSRAYVVVKATLWGLNFLLVTIAFSSMFLAIRHHHKVLLLAIPIIFTAIIYFPLNGFENRYSQPVYPLLLIFAGYGFSYLKDKFSLLNLRNKYSSKGF